MNSLLYLFTRDLDPIIFERLERYQKQLLHNYIITFIVLVLLGTLLRVVMEPMLVSTLITFSYALLGAGLFFAYKYGRLEYGSASASFLLLVGSLSILLFIFSPSLFASIIFLSIFIPIAFFLKDLKEGLFWVLLYIGTLILVNLMGLGTFYLDQTMSLFLLLSLLMTMAVSMSYEQKVILDNLTIFEQRKKLEQSVLIDPLTKVTTRYGFYVLMDEEMMQSRNCKRRSLSSMIIDINDLKQINSDHGHITGDIVLQELAQLVGDEIGKDDTIARWSGDEFILLLPRTSAEDACALAQRLKAMINKKRFGDVGVVTCSIGVSSMPENGPFDALLLRLDKALHKAKESRNSVICLDESLDSDQ